MEPMAAAAANWQTPQPIVEMFTFAEESVNRYVWYAGEDVPWPEIKGGWIKRCRMTPIVPFLIWERINDVPVDMRKGVRKDWHDREHQETQYEIRPQGIFESVMTQYGAWGLKELVALKGKTPQEVAALNIDATFIPWHDEEIPKPYRAIEQHINEALKTLNGNHLLRSVGEEMIQAVTDAMNYDQVLLGYEESQKELKYSNPGLRALSRLGRSRRDRAQNDMAELHNKAFDKAHEMITAQGSGGTDPALVTVMQEQNAMLREELAQNREMMKALLAERQADKPSRTRKPAQVDA